eukprot:CAMPEP_0119408756 /NCGR_PEP_ID=MMETSP1335-20130426/2215_1 /TAXON_ID=259385 /ORGANISM="Chrysoculter rhomboideus, Strain RCC1486" /LENGTH=331 /DNA_ID=CAMNT_0007433035 /DNA_START=120 /DNA_END=1115 /DNA_ORIENTATION=-
MPVNTEMRIHWLRSAAEQGHAKAQHNMGMFYHKGSEGLPEDKAMAVVWWRKAAAQGLQWSQLSLGGAYAVGDGVEQDEAESAVWFLKAAEQGDVEGQYEIGMCYVEGKGVTKNVRRGVRWLTKAADQNHVDAQYTLGTLLLHEIEDELRDHQVGARWLARAAEAGHKLAAAAYAECLATGRGVERDTEASRTWYEAGAVHAQSTISLPLGAEPDADGFVVGEVSDGHGKGRTVRLQLSNLSETGIKREMARAAKDGHADAAANLAGLAGDREATAKFCIGCGSREGARCARCGVAKFCSKDCQRKMWPVHKAHCVQWAQEAAATRAPASCD